MAVIAFNRTKASMDFEETLLRRAKTRVGTVLRGKWMLERLLGVGGMASVYAATHRNGKRGAVKLLHTELSSDLEARQRFLREGYVANQVNHPGAVSVLDDDIAEDGSVYLVMELLEGETVEARAQSQPRRQMAPAEVVHIAYELLDVLAAAHPRGIVHRDIKPENIFLTQDGQVKILDFGIARLRDLPGGGTATRTGTSVGTPAYMPPEQALGNREQIDARTDIWALGATMFSLLTGRQVHEADTVNKLLLAAMTKPAPPVRSLLPQLAPAMAEVVDRALAFEQKDRFQDARSMQQALRALKNVPLIVPSAVPAAPVAQPSIVQVPAITASAISRSSSTPRTSRGSASLIVGGLMGVAVALGIAFVAFQKDDNDPQGTQPTATTIPLPTAPASVTLVPEQLGQADASADIPDSGSADAEAPTDAKDETEDDDVKGSSTTTKPTNRGPRRTPTVKPSGSPTSSDPLNKWE